jgi:hypothetical protein
VTPVQDILASNEPLYRKKRNGQRAEHGNYIRWHYFFPFHHKASSGWASGVENRGAAVH